MKVRFRDGEREIVDHLALRMSKMNTRVLRYEDAVAAVNRAEMADYLNAKQKSIIADHFKRNLG
jgi:hypothetical protein